jgi:hypothetical protein
MDGRNNMKEKIRMFISFGEMSLKSIISFLFYVGCFIIIYKAFLWGKAIYLTNFYEKGVSYLQNNQKWFTSVTVNNLPLGVLGFITYFIVISLAWKLICELLYIIFERISRK